MFERYTEGARRTIFFARYEAGQYGNSSIEPEHLLLGLMRDDKRLARRALSQPGAAESIRKEIDARVLHRDRISTTTEIPLSAESKQILQIASNSAEKFGHRNVDNVHLLLAILRKEECAAAQVLKRHCVGRNIIEQMLQKHTERSN